MTFALAASPGSYSLACALDSLQRPCPLCDFGMLHTRTLLLLGQCLSTMPNLSGTRWDTVPTEGTATCTAILYSDQFFLTSYTADSLSFRDGSSYQASLIWPRRGYTPTQALLESSFSAVFAEIPPTEALGFRAPCRWFSPVFLARTGSSLVF